MFYIRVASVRKKAKQLKKHVSPGFLAELDLLVDKEIERSARNANANVTLKREDLVKLK